jgi:diguanylate cyclase (GGDEF)-like protein
MSGVSRDSELGSELLERGLLTADSRRASGSCPPVQGYLGSPVAGAPLTHLKGRSETADNKGMTPIWHHAGPTEEERPLAGKVAGVLWLMVVPIVGVALLPLGIDQSHKNLVILTTVPAVVWGAACLLFLPWKQLANPMIFHAPSILALPYIGMLVALTGTTRSPFAVTLLMLISFGAYFFPPWAAIPYIVGALAVQASPLLYDRNALDDGLLAQIWVAVFVYSAVGGVIMVGKQQLTSLKRAAEQLSLRDSLTGLSNRRALTEAMNRDVDGVRREDAVGLVLVDLDDFKQANTLHGLPAGDAVLCSVAEVLRETSRDDDMVVRLGGDEFAIVVDGADRKGMQSLAERLLYAINRAVADLSLTGLDLTASAGWAIYPDDAESLQHLVSVADLSLRGAKLSGKNCARSAPEWSPELAQ